MPLPSELRLSSKWDTCVERMLFHVGAGALVAGLASVVLFRPGGRAKGIWLGVGVGMGNAWAKCSYEFENEKKIADDIIKKA
mmetsp:Transcript_19961/g.33641  ORF Transcript_19961/g.33641 Transcript_19961/m.33641 type:complete len:82 (+) Transcript_19961:60-305(+)|eukprot:CAMPEP_0114414986 /NCGR_PEP_ID=MMETSP0103-20121206/1677_1 /TAXON_ID=37642 ORGANISM="Paraphysomonas imperforata, Strain PA2" /NCGR_SAMPLE_ID=MMETSP0103 /ASSEMBLY_ACC=CAM_ASM_000201 /LENGTH=81 /DNA_ID=CAMNT_0001583157 /DNA_START=69 /DNA_END=317 /DNA_ORIENTATION=+